MSGRGAWLRGLGAAILLALLGGRWAAVNTGERLWSEAIGAAGAHESIRSLSTTLSMVAFLAALVWCVGNMHFIYRAIGSVQMKRRIGNIEIDEALPRRYLLLAAWSVGLILAIALSRGTDDWWRRSALSGVLTATGVTEPVLGLDVSYYLFQLPWLRTLHGYVTLLAGVMLGVVAILYAAVGALRWEGRRLVVNDIARTHLGGVLAAMALALWWGYRLEPVELVAGIHHVPFDGVLSDVRLPIASVLCVAAGVTTVVSLLWMWVPRGVWVAATWATLLGGSFLGHYIVPSVVASIGDPELRSPARFSDAAARMEQLAYGLVTHDTTLGGSAPVPAAATRRTTDDRVGPLERAPVWDGLAVAVTVNRVTKTPPHRRVYDAILDLYAGPGRGPAEPVYLAPREVDYTADGTPSLAWADVHMAPGAVARGAVAVSASRATPAGLPLFIANLARPDSLSATPRDLILSDSLILFGNAPAAAEFLVVDSTLHAVGVRAGGFWRRLALAWILQSPHLFTSREVTDRSVVLWQRDVPGRLAAYAPFAQFGAAYPVVVRDRLVWVAPGYVSAEAFPLSANADWRTGSVQAMRAGFVGVVDAASGQTAVYLSGDSDPLSRAWAALAPTLIRPADSLPAALAAHVRYPDELFRIQARLLHDRQTGVAEAVAPALARARVEAQRSVASEPFWWVEGDSDPRLGLRSVMQRGEPPFVVGVLDGVMTHGKPSLTLTHLPQPVELAGASKFAARVVADQPELAAIAGPIRTMVIGNGVAGLQTMYGSVSATDPTRLVEVVVSWRGAVASGPTIAAALEHAASAARTQPVSDSVWNQARRLFQQLDDALKGGDWSSFGRSYGDLRRILGPMADSARRTGG
ncbi:MAG TPA: UPF0182 family protein [Gemmatimonadales bacterium]